MKVHKMTEWNAGQLLIEASDCLSNAEKELYDAGFKESAQAIGYAQRIIGEVFNKTHMGKSHTFGLRDIHTGQEPVEKSEK